MSAVVMPQPGERQPERRVNFTGLPDDGERRANTMRREEDSSYLQSVESYLTNYGLCEEDTKTIFELDPLSGKRKVSWLALEDAIRNRSLGEGSDVVPTGVKGCETDGRLCYLVHDEAGLQRRPGVYLSLTGKTMEPVPVVASQTTPASNETTRMEEFVRGFKEHELKADIKLPLSFWKSAIKERLHRQYTTRAARQEDINTLVDIDMKSFDSVYKYYGKDPTTLREELQRQFVARYEKLGGKWIRIFEREGHPCGFIMCCPTNYRPEDFTSWEAITSNGTLDEMYDPHGKYIYIITLSMVNDGSSVKGQKMLYGNQMGHMIEMQVGHAFFESRLPGLRSWVRKQCRQHGRKFDDLTPEDVQQFAQTYISLKKVIDGKEVPHDRLLREYHEVGCRFTTLLPNAYKDELSMNYGVIGIFDNPLPEKLRKNPLVSKAAGALVRAAFHSHSVSTRYF